MTKLLEQAVAEASRRPDDEQDLLATLILAEIEDEQKWAASFAATTDAQWDALAAMAQIDIESGGATSLDDLIGRPRG